MRKASSVFHGFCFFLSSVRLNKEDSQNSLCPGNVGVILCNVWHFEGGAVSFVYR